MPQSFRLLSRAMSGGEFTNVDWASLLPASTCARVTLVALCWPWLCVLAPAIAVLLCWGAAEAPARHHGERGGNGH